MARGIGEVPLARGWRPFLDDGLDPPLKHEVFSIFAFLPCWGKFCNVLIVESFFSAY